MMKKDKSRIKAPRLVAYISNSLFSNDALLMKRSDWEQMKKNLLKVFEIDIYKTPMREIMAFSRVIGAIASRISFNLYKIKIYRIDSKDGPPFNVDSYLLHEDFSKRDDYDDLVNYASTSDDDNMKLFHDENVILEKIPPEEDHHSSFEQLPEVIRDKLAL